MPRREAVKANWFGFSPARLGCVERQNMSTVGYMFDSVIFNRLLDGFLGVEEIAHRKIVVTHVQFDELNNTPEQSRRQKLVAAFNRVAAAKVATSSAVWGISKLGEASWASDDGVYQSLLTRIAEFDKQAKKKKTPANQQRDALIAETAIKQGLVLVTEDEQLANAVRDQGGEAISLDQFRLGVGG